MTTNIRLDPNSDAASELDILKTRLKENSRFINMDLNAKQVVELAIDCLYDLWQRDRQTGEHQRKMYQR